MHVFKKNFSAQNVVGQTSWVAQPIGSKRWTDSCLLCPIGSAANVCSPCSMRQRDWCTTVLSTIESRRSCATCNGYAFLNATRSVWPFLCSAAITRPHLNTSRETCSGLMTTSVADDYDRRQLTSWLCVAHDSVQSVIVRSVLLHLECGTICLPTSSLHSPLPPLNSV